MSPRFVLGRENVPCVAEVVNRSLKADCTDFKLFVLFAYHGIDGCWLNVFIVDLGATYYVSLVKQLG